MTCTLFAPLLALGLYAVWSLWNAEEEPVSRERRAWNERKRDR
jgi:hypothetical protein